MNSSPTLRVQINQIDHTLCPSGPLDNSPLPLAPVIRIYGPSSTGSKTCVHVHQVYPYFFVEYTEKLNPRHVKRYTDKLTHSLNHAIAMSLKRNPKSHKSRFIRAILLVKGVHFYGFSSSYSPFLKVQVVDPSFVARAVAILQSGSVMSTRFHTYESHLSYILQFLADFGLYGCGWIDLGEVLQRGAEEEEPKPEPEHAVSEGSRNAIDSTLFKLSPHFRQSRMSLEVDAAAHQILNRHRLSARNINHKLEIPAPPLPKEPLVISVRELWDDERNRRRTRGLNPSPDIPIDLSDGSRSAGGDWVAEARWWDEIRKRIVKERESEIPIEESSKGWEKWVMTTFESVEALWETPWRLWKPGDSSKDSTGSLPGSGEKSDALQLEETTDDQMDIDVDVSMLSTQGMSLLAELEEEEWARGMENNEPLQEDAEQEEVYDDDHDPQDEPLNSQQNSDSQPKSQSPDPFQDIAAVEDLDPSKVTFASPPGSDSGYQLNEPPAPTRSRSNADDILTLSPTHRKRKASNPAQPPSLRTQLQEKVVSKQPTHTPQQSTGSHQHEDIADTLGQPQACTNHSPVTSDTSDEDGATNPSKKRRLTPGLRDQEVASPDESLSVPEDRIIEPSVFRLARSFTKKILPNANGYAYAVAPPTTSSLLGSLDGFNVPNKIYRAPYYSIPNDAPDKAREYAGLVYHLRGGDYLEDWVATYDEKEELGKWPSRHNAQLDPAGVGGWEYASRPPSIKEVKLWLASDDGKVQTKAPKLKMRSQIEGPTQFNLYGLKTSPGTVVSDSSTREKQDMTVLSLEVFSPSRGELLPDPGVDEMAAVFYSYRKSDTEPYTCGVIAVDSVQLSKAKLRDFTTLESVSTEVDLINRVVDIVVDLDPDALVGWDIQVGSWGYLNARGTTYGFDIADLISRAPIKRTAGSEQWETRTTSTFKVAGRHVLNLWRLMRSELTLNIYTYENVAFQVLKRRLPRYSFATLSEWYRSSTPAHISSVLRHFIGRTSMVLDMLHESEIITKTAEFARVFGVDFHSVISRGSQFKVESFMFRIAKPESFVLVSPSKSDVGKQNAAECMPLIMEPQSAFYTSPLVVLDFQSLYPSIMIAYNYCYSTCLGRVVDFQGRNKFGVIDLDRPPGLLEKLHGNINVAPNGMMYVKPEVRKGLLGRMLVELLETRVMVKQAMKGSKDDKTLQRILDARQLGLKYIANVTYGYTSASFSGRMPAVEIADSIVQSGRETLEKAILLINQTKKWGAEVVYGDTDSMFIYLQGKTKEQAFRIGHDIADSITALNPAPIKLKFEKVYLPCVLMAKKRYVGFKYESLDDKEPVFDAKGIETVRRDGVLAQQKMTENSLKILFRSQDLSEVKAYCFRSWTKLLENRVPVQDFIFAKEVRMGTYSDKGPPPPGASVAAKRSIQDPNDEPQYGERVPYVIARGVPGSRLVDRAMDPLELLNRTHMRLDATYYISRVLIPPLERIFNLLGADVRQWFNEMPKPLVLDAYKSPSKLKPEVQMLDRFNIDEHFSSSQCLVCGGHAYDGICYDCRTSRQSTMSAILRRIQANERRLTNAQRVCASCTGSPLSEPIQCISLDCPWLYARKKAENKTDFLVLLQQVLRDLELDDLSESGSEAEQDSGVVRYWGDSDSDSDSSTTLPEPPRFMSV